LHQQRDETDPASENLDALIRRVASASMEEIDRVIRELERVREMLRNEGERVNSEITRYAGLNHAAVIATKIIADNLKQWKDAPGKSG
jgi:ribosomal protein L18E